MVPGMLAGDLIIVGNISSAALLNWDQLILKNKKIMQNDWYCFLFVIVWLEFGFF